MHNVSRKIESWTIRTQVLAGPLLLFVITLFILIGAGYSALQLQQSDTVMSDTMLLLSDTNVVARYIIDMETAVRGYALTADQQFLRPYHVAQTQLPLAIERVRARLADRPEQLAQLELLERRVQGWQTMVAEVEIDLVQRGEDAIPMVRSGVGRMRMDEIRATLDAMQNAEYSRLAVLTAEHETANQILVTIYIASIVIAFGAMGLALWIGERIARPITALGEAAGHIAAGDYNVTITNSAGSMSNPAAGNELSQTRRAFTFMIQALTQAHAKLRDQANHMEEQARIAENARHETAAILDAVSEAILVVRPNQQIVAANSRVAQLFGLEPGILLSQSPEQLLATRMRVFADIDMVDTYMADALENPQSQNKIVVAQKWPEQRDLELFTAPVQNSAGDYTGRVFAFRDITKEREADRLKNEFISMVSHELRTPLTSIKGFVDLLVSGDAGELTEDQTEFLEVVKNNADRLVALVNDLLDISRLEAGRVELHRTSIAVDALLRSLLVSLRPQIHARQHQVIHNFPADLPAAYGDGERITQVFINLISNAVKYTPMGGTITISAQPAGEFVRIDIADTGIGLSEADQAKLFTRFFRAKNRATQDAGGTGLGLSITKSLVEMHGGTIHVTSAPGAGSTFTVMLPIAPGATQVRSQTVYPGGRILVVEDEPDIAELMRVYLTRAGYDVDIAGDATSALALAKEYQPDLILLDIVLPEINGMTLLSWLKSNEAVAAIPVVLLSILPDDGQGRILGAVDYLHKPVEKDILLNRIGTILTAANPPLVLTIDNNEQEREQVAMLLQRAGYRAATIGSGDEISLRIAELHPDLIMVDIQTPGEDTDNLLRTLQELERVHQVPIIVMSGVQSEDIRNAIEMVQSIENVTQLTGSNTKSELAQAINDKGHG